MVNAILQGQTKINGNTNTNLNGILKGDGTIITTAIPGQDYAKAFSRPALYTLIRDNWDNYVQILTVDGVSVDETSQIVRVSPVIEYTTAYITAGIYISAIEENKLIFSCTSMPTVNLNIYISIQNL